MIVVSLSTVPAKLRGYLTLYLWEIDTNVYVGRVSARVRELLWKRIEKEVSGRGRAVMAFPSASEQGFDFKICGMSFDIIDYEGMRLVMRPSEKIMVASHMPKIEKPKKSAMKTDYIVLDLETTGLDVEKDRIIEIGAIKVRNGEIKDTFTSIVKIDGGVPENIAKMTGITNEDISNGREFEDVMKELKCFTEGLFVIGYNIVNFDMRILHHECIRSVVEFPFTKVVDVLPLAKTAISGLSSYSLESVSRFIGIQQKITHRALDDCMLCHEVYKKLYGG